MTAYLAIGSARATGGPGATRRQRRLEPGAALALARDLRALAELGLIDMRADGVGDVRCELTELGHAVGAGDGSRDEGDEQ
jgi:hypothetical protein